MFVSCKYNQKEIKRKMLVHIFYKIFFIWLIVRGVGAYLVYVPFLLNVYVPFH